MSKKVIYTCITGRYDEPSVHTYVDSSWDYILYTDNQELINKGSVAHWQVKPLYFSSLTNVKNARWHKVNPHILLPEYHYSLWIDANISIENKNVFDRLNQLISENNLVSIPLHGTRDCIFEEATIIKSTLVDDPKIVNPQIKFLQQEQYPKNNGLSETGILFRQHNDVQIVEAQNIWWKMINTYSKRDQLSCNYAFWKINIDITPFYEVKGAHRNCGDFLLHTSENHNQNRLEGYRILPRWLINLIAIFIPCKNLRRKVKDKLKSYTVITQK